MCTVTIAPAPGIAPGIFADSGLHDEQLGRCAAGWRMACSRDERHGRAPALPPELQSHDGIEALMPIDPVSGGTWVAVNAAGLALTLLNYNLPEPPTDRTVSRGGVIPQLIGAVTLDEAVARCGAIERERMLPFRLVMCDGRQVALWRSTEPASMMEVTALDNQPVFFTSSGLGDHLVEQPRRAVFEGWFTQPVEDWAARQDALHRHRWPDRPHLSICMDRDDARTVSYTTIEVGPKRIAMHYHPDRPDRPATPITLTLNRRVTR